MLFFKKAIVEEIVAAPVQPTAYSYSAAVNFIRDAASSVIPPTAVAEAKVAAARLLNQLVSSVPSRATAKDAAFAYARDVASSIGSRVPDDPTRAVSLLVAENKVLLLSLIFALFAVLLVRSIPSSSSDGLQEQIKEGTKEEGTKDAQSEEITKDEVSTAPLSSTSGSGTHLNGDEVAVGPFSEILGSGNSIDGLSTSQDAPCYEDDDDDEEEDAEDYVVSTPSMSPSFEEFLKIAVHDARKILDDAREESTESADVSAGSSFPAPPQTPVTEWKKEGLTRADTPMTASASVSGSSDDGSAAKSAASTTPTRRYSQLKKSLSNGQIKRTLSNSKIFRSSLRSSARKLSIK